MKISVDSKALDQLVSDLQAIPKDTSRAAVRAVNDTLKSVKAEAIRQIYAGYYMKAGKVRSLLSINRATKGQNIEGEVIGRGPSRVPLAIYAIGAGKKKFSTTRTAGGGYRPKKGIKVKIKKRSGVKILRGGFTSKGVVKRRVDKRRYALKSLSSIAPIGLLKTGKYDKILTDHADRQLAKNLKNQIAQVLK